MNTLKTPFLVLISLFVASPAAFAGPQELLALQRRPTMTEFIQAHDPWPAQNPYKNAVVEMEYTSKLFNLRVRMPALIAQFEKAFPGATYYSLGRDAAGAADALDAFYLSLGQS